MGLLTRLLSIFGSNHPQQSKLDFLKPAIIDINNYNYHSKEVLDLIFKVLDKEQDEGGKALTQLISLIFEKQGYQTEIIDGFYDQGIDIVVKDNGKNFIAIQCKSYSPQRNTKRIQAKDTSAFTGDAQNFTHKIFITTSFFTGNSLNLSNNKIINIDRLGLLHF